MATPERTAPSKTLTDAATSERYRLGRELAKLDLRLDALQLELEQGKTQRTQLAAQIKRIDALIGEPAPDTAAHEEAPTLGYLRGAEIRRVAVELAPNHNGQPAAPLHYTDWYQRLLKAGYAIDGRDPLATFLTQLNRSPLIVKTAEPGHYTLDLSAIDQLQTRLTNLHHELSGLHAGQQTINEIASVRDRRDQLLAEITQTERTLDEALNHRTPAT